MSVNPAQSLQSFYTDRPIDSIAQDALGRSSFARSFAEAITRHHGKESLTLAINAPWGEGKTSFKNLVLDVLKKEHSNRVLPLSFSPWEWASQNQVAGAFFAEIAKQLELGDQSQQAKDVALRLRSLGRYLGLAGRITGPVGLCLDPVIPGSSLVAIALGKGLAKAKETALESATDYEQRAAESKKPLPLIKQDLKDALAAYLKPPGKLLLIVVDDIDRLAPDEIRLVFQMIRANGDFPGLVFLLLYDEQYVARALRRFFPGSNRDFMEKIVQFQVDLPVPIQNRLREHTLRELRRILGHRPAYLDFLDEKRFNHLWEDGLDQFIVNLRHAGRLLSSFEFHLGAFQSNEAEVNPLDLFVLETLRLLEPGCYRAVRAAAGFIFPESDMHTVLQMREEDDEKWRKGVKGLAGWASEARRESAENMIAELLPNPTPRNVPRALYGWADEQARNRRLCHILYFYRYFRLAVDDHDIPDERVTDLLNTYNMPSEFVRSLGELGRQGKATLALTKILARDKLGPSEQPTEMISLLAEFADARGDHSCSPELISLPRGIDLLIELQLLADLDSSSRLARLSDALRCSKGIHRFAQIARNEHGMVPEATEVDPTNPLHVGPHLNRPDFQLFNERVADRLMQLLKDGQVALDERWIASMRWLLQFAEKQVKAHVDDLLSDPTALAVLLMAIVDDAALGSLDDLAQMGRAKALFLVRQGIGPAALLTALQSKAEQLQALGPEVGQRADWLRANLDATEPK